MPHPIIRVAIQDQRLSTTEVDYPPSPPMGLPFPLTIRNRSMPSCQVKNRPSSLPMRRWARTLTKHPTLPNTCLPSLLVPPNTMPKQPSHPGYPPRQRIKHTRMMRSCIIQASNGGTPGLTSYHFNPCPRPIRIRVDEGLTFCRISVNSLLSSMTSATASHTSSSANPHTAPEILATWVPVVLVTLAICTS